MSTERVCLGVMTGARGLKGEIRIKSFTENPADICAYGTLCDEAGHPVAQLTVVGEVKDQVIARVEGVNDRTAAEALKGTKLYVDRDALPALQEDEFYYADLIGLNVELVDGQPLGTVKTVQEIGAMTVLEIETVAESGYAETAVDIPFTREAVPAVDLAAGRIVVDPPAGLLTASAEEESTHDG